MCYVHDTWEIMNVIVKKYDASVRIKQFHVDDNSGCPGDRNDFIFPRHVSPSAYGFQI